LSLKDNADICWLSVMVLGEQEWLDSTLKWLMVSLLLFLFHSNIYRLFHDKLFKLQEYILQVIQSTQCCIKHRLI